MLDLRLAELRKMGLENLVNWLENAIEFYNIDIDEENIRIISLQIYEDEVSITCEEWDGYKWIESFTDIFLKEHNPTDYEKLVEELKINNLI